MKLSRFYKGNLTSLFLRLALATVFLYAAISSTLNPREWVGYLPDMLTRHVQAELLLKFFSIYEFALAALLIAGVYTRYVALLCAATLAGIVISNSRLIAVSFRDIGLALAAIALFFSEQSSARR